MSDYGVTDTGFSRKPKTQIVSELEDLFLAKFGQDLDVDSESPEGQIIAVIAEAADPLWELAEYAYNAFNPVGATGVTLENLALLNTLTRKEATATTVTVFFEGVIGTVIPEGSSVSSNSEDTGGITYSFTTNEDVTITSSGVSTLVTCTETGSVQIPTGSIIIIDTPIVGLASVTNTSAGNVGLDEETDPELRSRRSLEVALPSVATVDALYAGILDIDTVISTKIYENDSAIQTSIDGVTIEPHAIKAIVQGGGSDTEAEEIAQAIFVRKSPGIQTSGSESWTIQDSQGFDKTFYWDTPTIVPIYINITTNVTSITGLNNEGQDIKDAILAFAVDQTTGYVIGDDVSYARLYTPVNSVDDHDVQSLTISSDGVTFVSSDLTMDGASLAEITDANISITFV